MTDHVMLRVKDILPNPFKKEINGGELNEHQVQTLLANMKELDLMGALPVVRISGKYHLVAGHHRLQEAR